MTVADPGVIWANTPKGAQLSDCGKYRYALWRCWSFAEGLLIFVMCNPSTADADKDDATIRKCVGFAKRLGFGGISVVNLCPIRSTDPKLLKAPGSEAHLYASSPPSEVTNTAALERAMIQASHGRAGLIAAWGTAARDNLPHYEARVAQLRKLASGTMSRLQSLRVASDGKTPCHPLMLPYDLLPQAWPLVRDDREK